MPIYDLTPIEAEFIVEAIKIALSSEPGRLPSRAGRFVCGKPKRAFKGPLSFAGHLSGRVFGGDAVPGGAPRQKHLNLEVDFGQIFFIRVNPSDHHFKKNYRTSVRSIFHFGWPSFVPSVS